MSHRIEITYSTSQIDSETTRYIVGIEGNENGDWIIAFDDDKPDWMIVFESGGDNRLSLELEAETDEKEIRDVIDKHYSILGPGILKRNDSEDIICLIEPIDISRLVVSDINHQLGYGSGLNSYSVHDYVDILTSDIRSDLNDRQKLDIPKSVKVSIEWPPNGDIIELPYSIGRRVENTIVNFEHPDSIDPLMERLSHILLELNHDALHVGIMFMKNYKLDEIMKRSGLGKTTVYKRRNEFYKFIGKTPIDKRTARGKPTRPSLVKYRESDQEDEDCYS